MYRVMVVDDETVFRLTVKTIMDWEQNGFEIVAEASDGIEALDKYKGDQGIDIILTDISMPKMNGLEFIKGIRALDQTVPIIVLSAYNDFQFAREAFKLGAMDYILKPEICPEAVLKLLDKAVDIIKNGKRSREEQKIKNSVLREKLLTELISGKFVGDVLSRLEEYELNISARNIVVGLIVIDDFKFLEEKYDSVQFENLNHSIVSILSQKKEEFATGEFINIASEKYVFILSFPKDASIASVTQKVGVVFGNINHALKSYLDISATIGISEIRSGFENISLLYKQAYEAVSLRFIMGKGRRIFYSDVEHFPHTQESYLSEKSKGLFTAYENNNLGEVESELKGIFEYILSFNSTNISKIYSLYLELIYLLIAYLNDKGIKTEDVFGKDIDFLKRITVFETVSELNNWVRNIILYIFNELSDRSNVKSLKMKKALEYIKQNYNHDLSLKIVSESLELNETYFSRMFAKEMGESFINYITKLRINKAKELMKNTNMNISEISAQVGYENLEHFSRVFKKVCGFSPNKYRKE